MRFYSKILFIICVVFYTNNMFSQNSLELEYTSQTLELKAINSHLDSLNTILQNKANVIEAEKVKNGKNSNKIATLLSGTASLTNRIDSLRNDANKLSNKIYLTKKKLHQFYTTKIDSLNKISNNNKSVSVEKIKLIEKRLLVSPEINSLSFSPQSVLRLEPSKDSIKQKIYTEYLNEAFQEVDQKMAEIQGLKKEITNILQLNKETKEFLEDIDFDNNFAVYSNPNTAERSLEYTNDYNTEGRFTDEKASLNTVNTQSKYFADILFQFGLSETYNPSSYLNTDENSTITNLKQFNTLIEAVEKQLKDYKIIISNKLKGS